MTRPVALVTGAARGIGLATARLFLNRGWSVAMVDRDAPELARAADGLVGATPFVCDVSDPAQVTETVPQVAAMGSIAALVNNAGVADFGPIEGHDFAR